MIRLVSNAFISGFFLLLLGLGLQAQINPCATVMSVEQRDWLRKFKQNPPFDFKVLEGEECFYLPIQFHVLGDDEGDGYFERKNILQLMCDINEKYKATGAGMQFFMNNNELIYHDNEDIYMHEDFTANSFFFQNNVDDVINVYIVADPASACGYYTPGPDNIAVGKSCSGYGSTTLTHELGHYFSLDHPFYNWEFFGDNMPNNLKENVARTGPDANCHEEADMFCDTAPDYIADRWNCPNDTEFTDPLGETFTVDGSIYMSYSNDGCQSRFTPEQIEAMQANVQLVRSNLLDYEQVLVLDDITETQIHYPINGSQVPAGEDVLLQWQAIEGATHYLLTIESVAFDLEIFVQDNSFKLEDLEENTFIFWSVKPFNDGNFCESLASGAFNVKSNLSLAVKNLDARPPSCEGGNDGSIEVEVVGGIGPYTYTWQDGTEGTSIEGLEEGVYELTVYDEGADVEEIIKIEIEEPKGITGTVTQQTDGVMSVEVEGGSTPYSITWPDGATENSTSGLSAGTHTILIEDGSSCSKSIDFEVLDITYETFKPSCVGDENGQFEIQEILGGTGPYTYIYEEEEFSEPMIESLVAGTYQIEIRDSLENSGIFTFEIEDPEVLSVNVVNNETVMSAFPSGGSPPYLIKWEVNGETKYGEELSLEGVSPGLYSGELKDAYNCSKPFNFFVTEMLGVSEIQNGNITLFPNPVRQSNQFTLEFDIAEAKQPNLKVYNSLGNEIYHATKNIPSGISQWAVSTDKWAAGIYFVFLELRDGSTATHKLIIE